VYAEPAHSHLQEPGEVYAEPAPSAAAAAAAAAALNQPLIIHLQEPGEVDGEAALLGLTHLPHLHPPLAPTAKGQLPGQLNF